MLHPLLSSYFGYVREHPSLEQWPRKQHVLFSHSLCYKEHLLRQSRQRIFLGLYTLPDDVYNVLFRFGQVNSELLTERAAYGNGGAHYSSEVRRFYIGAMSRYCLIQLIIS